MKYIVQHEGQEIPVPESIGADESALRRALSAVIPGIAEAKITATVTDDVTTYSIVKTAGTKGAGAFDDIIAHLAECKGGTNPVVAYFQALQDIDLTAIPAAQAVEISAKVETILEAGDAQMAAIVKGVERLAAASPQASPALVPGF
jgi:hypothetical protein